MKLFGSLRCIADDGGFLSWWSAKKNNSKRSTILQHLLAEPHQQMLQNSSALEIKGSVVKRRCKGWEVIAEMAALQAGCSLKLIAYGEKKWKMCLIFCFIPHKYNPPQCPIYENYKTIKINALSLFLCVNTEHILPSRILHISRTVKSSPLFFLLISIFIILHQTKHKRHCFHGDTLTW